MGHTMSFQGLILRKNDSFTKGEVSHSYAVALPAAAHVFVFGAEKLESSGSGVLGAPPAQHRSLC